MILNTSRRQHIIHMILYKTLYDKQTLVHPLKTANDNKKQKVKYFKKNKNTNSTFSNKFIKQ